MSSPHLTLDCIMYHVSPPCERTLTYRHACTTRTRESWKRLFCTKSLPRGRSFGAVWQCGSVGGFLSLPSIHPSPRCEAVLGSGRLPFFAPQKSTRLWAAYAFTGETTAMHRWRLEESEAAPPFLLLRSHHHPPFHSFFHFLPPPPSPLSSPPSVPTSPRSFPSLRLRPAQRLLGVGLRVAARHPPSEQCLTVVRKPNSSVASMSNA